MTTTNCRHMADCDMVRKVKELEDRLEKLHEITDENYIIATERINELNKKIDDICRITENAKNGLANNLKVIQYVRDHPGSSIREISNGTDIARSTVDYIVKENTNFRVIKRNRETKVFLVKSKDDNEDDNIW